MGLGGGIEKEGSVFNEEGVNVFRGQLLKLRRAQCANHAPTWRGSIEKPIHCCSDEMVAAPLYIEREHKFALRQLRKAGGDDVLVECFTTYWSACDEWKQTQYSVRTSAEYVDILKAGANAVGPSEGTTVGGLDSPLGQGHAGGAWVTARALNSISANPEAF